MSDSSYDLLFKGECLADTDPAQVRANLGALLKLDAQQLEQMFSGRTMVVRRAADREYAARFQQAFKQAGARLRVMPVSSDAAADVATPAQSESQALATTSAAASAPTSVRKPSLAERLAAQAAAAAPAGTMLVDGTVAWQKPSIAPAARAGMRPVDAAPIDSATIDAASADVAAPGEAEVATGTSEIATSGLQLAPLGSDMLSAQERTQAALPAVQVDISQLTIAPSVGNLPTLPRAGADAPPPVVPDLVLSPAGVDLGERQEFVELPLDLSHLSLAELGARVGPPREVVSAEFDLSGLSLAPPGTPLLA